MSRRSRKSSALVAILVGLLCHSESSGIVIRHDRDDARYLVPPERYPELVEVGRAHGTLVDSRWVLTAAHVADGSLSPFSGTVRIAGREFPVRRIVLHPRWVGDLGRGLAQLDWVDMALIELAEPVGAVTPARLYSGSDEVGKEIVFVGSGRTGTGLTGGVVETERVRAATNVVSRADADWLQFDFDAPPGGTDLEGVSGPGDSGNGALLEVDGVRFVLGVGSRNDHVGRGLEECTYGTVEFYARVSTQLDWIRQTIAAKTGPGSLRELDQGGWPDTPVGRTARRFFEAYNQADRESLVAFAERSLSEERRRMLPIADWVDLWLGQRERTGPVRPRSYSAMSEIKIAVLADSAEHWRGYTFELLGSAPHLVREIGVRREHSLHGRPLPSPGAPVAGDKEKTDE